MDEMELMWRGKHLLTLEEWQKFALCPHCHNRKCSACVSRPSDLTELEQIERFYMPITDDSEGDDPDTGYIPRKLWDIAIQCCSCGSRHHITDWLEKAMLVPEMYYIQEVVEAMLRAAKKEQEGSLRKTT